jgi:hypothetical protein
LPTKRPIVRLAMFFHYALEFDWSRALADVKHSWFAKIEDGKAGTLRIRLTPGRLSGYSRSNSAWNPKIRG